MVHVKDLLRLLGENKGSQPVMRASKEAPFVPESMPINDLLTLLRAEKSQTAMVVDEYGGTAGLVTMEDVIEEVVGDIHDEYDEEEYRIQKLSDGSIIVDARLPVDRVNEMFGVSLPEDDDYDSAGGYVFHQLGTDSQTGRNIEWARLSNHNPNSQRSAITNPATPQAGRLTGPFRLLAPQAYRCRVCASGFARLQPCTL